MVADRQGIEIDYCPRCRGVWLDRGELEKLIERSAQHYGGHGGHGGHGRDDDDSDWGDDRRKYGGHPPQPGYQPPGSYPPGGYPPPGQYPPKKKEGFFGRLFDFD